MTAGRYDFTIYNGADWTQVWTVKDSSGTAVNLTGYSSSLVIKERPESSSTLLTLTESAGITLGGAAGTITPVLTDTQVAALPTAKLFYYLTITTGSTTTRLMQGNIEKQN